MIPQSTARMPEALVALGRRVVDPDCAAQDNSAAALCHDRVVRFAAQSKADVFQRDRAGTDGDDTAALLRESVPTWTCSIRQLPAPTSTRAPALFQAKIGMAVATSGAILTLTPGRMRRARFSVPAESFASERKMVPPASRIEVVRSTGSGRLSTAAESVRSGRSRVPALRSSPRDGST